MKSNTDDSKSTSNEVDVLNNNTIQHDMQILNCILKINR